MEWTPNANQKKFLEVLSNEPRTLAELGELAGVEFKTGSINTLVKKGLIKCNKDALERVCPCCGHKTKVSTYEIAQVLTLTK